MPRRVVCRKKGERSSHRISQTIVRGISESAVHQTRVRRKSASPRAATRIAANVFRNEFRRRRIAPSRRQRPHHAGLLRNFQTHVRGPAPSPCSIHRRKHFRLRAHEILLLVREKLHHPHAHLRIPQRRENFSAHAKIRMVHMRALRRFRKTKRQSSKIRLRHRRSSTRAELHRIINASLPEPARRCSSSTDTYKHARDLTLTRTPPPLLSHRGVKTPLAPEKISAARPI